MTHAYLYYYYNNNTYVLYSYTHIYDADNVLNCYILYKLLYNSAVTY